MFCPKCGKEITDDSTFCKFCGERVEGEREAATRRGRRDLTKKERLELKFTIPQLEEDIALLQKRRKMLTRFFVASLILSFVTIGGAVAFTILSYNCRTVVDLYYVTYEAPFGLYVSLASLCYSFFTLFLVATIVMPILKSVLIDKKIAKRKTAIEILKS